MHYYLLSFACVLVLQIYKRVCVCESETFDKHTHVHCWSRCSQKRLCDPFEAVAPLLLTRHPLTAC